LLSWRTSYPRGGGESGADDDSSGSELDRHTQATASVGGITEAKGASTAAGPSSDSAIAARGSAVLRHEQERDPDVGLEPDRVWCIGHICPSPWSQVHSAPTVLADVVEHNAVGTDTSKPRWSTSQPPATRRVQPHKLCISGQPSTIGSTRARTLRPHERAGSRPEAIDAIARRERVNTALVHREERRIDRGTGDNQACRVLNRGEVSRIDSESAALVLSDGTQVAISRSRRPVVERVIALRMGAASTGS
jgi:hypothetical protein